VKRALFAAAVLALLSAIPAFTAGIPVPATHLSQSSFSIGPEELKPVECNSITLDTINVGSAGGAGNDLVLSGSGGGTVRGNGGDDCILAGGGNDTVRGDAGYDICIGGPGTDTFHASCEQTVQ
jgi:hypothetical protein